LEKGFLCCQNRLLTFKDTVDLFVYEALCLLRKLILDNNEFNQIMQFSYIIGVTKAFGSFLPLCNCIFRVKGPFEGTFVFLFLTVSAVEMRYFSIKYSIALGSEGG
jgi:hypothetical protein